MPDGLDQKALAHARRAEQKHVRLFPDEPARRQFLDLPAFDRRVEREVEFVEIPGLAEAGGAHAPLDLPAAAHRQFVLEDQLQKLGVVQAIAGGFRQPHFQALGQAREPQLLQILLQ